MVGRSHQSLVHKDNRLHYVNNYVGLGEQMVIATLDVPTGQNVVLSAAFEKGGQEPTATHGTLRLYHGETKVGHEKTRAKMGSGLEQS
jgi:hypothetical protein